MFYDRSRKEALLDTCKYGATTKIKPKSRQGARAVSQTAPANSATATLRAKMSKLDQNIIMDAHNLIERVSMLEELQVIFVKLWSLSSKAEEYIKWHLAKTHGTVYIKDKNKRALSPHESAT